MLKRTLIKLIFASIGFSYSVLALENDKQIQSASDQETDAFTRLPSEKLTSLTVTGTARVGHLHVFEKSHMQGHLNVDDDVDISEKLEVKGDSLVKGHAEIQGSLNCENNVNMVKKLTVHDQGVFKDNVIIDKNLHIKEDLQVDGDGTFHEDVDVSGRLHAKDNLQVDGEACFNGECFSLSVDKKLKIGKNSQVEELLNVEKNVIISENLHVADCNSVFGNLTVCHHENLGENLQINENVTISGGLNVNDDVNITGTLSIKGNKCLEGGLCHKKFDTKDIITPTIQTDFLKVKNDVEIKGTLFTNDIDPLPTNPLNITSFSGNVSIDRCKKLFVSEINPGIIIMPNQNSCPLANCPQVITCPAEESPTPEIIQGTTTCLRGNMALDPSSTFIPHIFMVNTICPVAKKTCGDCQPNENGTTCLKGNMAIMPFVSNVPDGEECTIATGPHKLLVNHIDPIKTDSCGICIEDHSSLAATCFSGNIAINPCESLQSGCPKKILVNTINPVKIVNGICLPDDSEKASTCLGANVAIHPGLDTIASHTLFVNWINPVKKVDNNCVADENFCASTHFSGNVSIKKGHYFGQLDSLILRKASEAFTECAPVLRLTFTNTDPNQDPFPQGAWVKLSAYGQISFDQNNLFPRGKQLDIFSELYFFVGAGNNAPCSSFVGSLNGLIGVNTFSGHACLEIIEQITGPLGPIPSQPSQGQFSNTLFEFMPNARNAQSIFALLGTTASSPGLPNAVDILLMGATPFPFTEFPSITNLTIFYEIISPNLDPKNPPCLPDPLLDQAIYDTACQNLINTYISALPV